MSQILSETTGVQSRTSHLSESERYRLLSDDRRRVVLDVLADRTAPIDLDDLVAAVDARERSVGGTEATAENVTVALHHVHLPKMTDLGVLSYDPELNRIE